MLVSLDANGASWTMGRYKFPETYNRQLLAPQSAKKYLQSTQSYLREPRSIWKYLKVTRSTLKTLKSS